MQYPPSRFLKPSWNDDQDKSTEYNQINENPNYYELSYNDNDEYNNAEIINQNGKIYIL